MANNIVCATLLLCTSLLSSKNAFLLSLQYCTLHLEFGIGTIRVLLFILNGAENRRFDYFYCSNRNYFKRMAVTDFDITEKEALE